MVFLFILFNPGNQHKMRILNDLIKLTLRNLEIDIYQNIVDAQPVRIKS